MFAAHDHKYATDELLEWNSLEAVHQIRTGSITAEHYAAQLLKRHRETSALNAFITLYENRVLESARAVDVARSQNKSLGPLAGLPVAVKDNINVAGYPTTAGVSVLRDYYPTTSARVVENLIAKGAIVLGKANLDELGREFTNSNQVYGFAHNPYDTTRVPGGGAGGTAVAISARVTPAGLGSDTAGSARIPASYCAISGFRPSTSGRFRGWTMASWTVSGLEDGLVPISFAVSTPAPMGRTVSDVALLHAAATGTTIAVRQSHRGARIGVPRAFFWEDLEPEVAQVCERALQKLRAAGATLVEVNLGQWAKDAAPVFFGVATLHGMKDLGDFLSWHHAPATLQDVIGHTLNKDIRARTQNILEHPVTPEQGEEFVKARIKLAIQFEELLKTQQLAGIIYPTVPILPPPIRPQGDNITDTIDLNGQQINQFVISLRNTSSASVIGVPALSLPVGLSSKGLPVGLSLAGPSDGDTRLLGLALSLEDVFGRMPPPRLQPDQLASATQVGPTITPSISSAPPPTSAPPTSAPSTSAPLAMPGASDDLAHVLTLLKQSAYLNLYGSFDLPDPSKSNNFAAAARLSRYDIDFRINSCGPGFRAINQLGENFGRALLNWTFQSSGGAAPNGSRPFTLNDVFVFDDEGQNQLRGAGSGRLIPGLFADGSFGVEANGNVIEGTGIFAGVQGFYVLTGTCSQSRLKIHFTIRLMDPTGRLESGAQVSRVSGSRQAGGQITSLALLGEPDPDHPVQMTPTGATVHELLRAVYTEFDRGRGHDRLRSAISLGPIVAHWRTDVIFNPRDPSAPGTPDKPLPVRLENIKITFLDRVTGTLEASITDGLGFQMTLPGVSGPLFHMSGFGPIGPGTDHFRYARGTVSLLGALDLVPAAFSNYYLLNIVDPDGDFRC